VTPILAVADVRRAVDWYGSVFGFVEHVRIGEAHRAQLGLDGERAEVIVRELKDDEHGAVAGSEIMLRVDDVNAVLEAARRSGAHGDAAGRDMPYGERQGSVTDPFGHRWVLTQTVRDADPADWGGATVAPRV
jgi:uncharacterized glyoxalase superfamily protein PhnB